MYEIRETHSATTVAALTVAEFAELQAHVEGLGPEGGALYVDAASLAALPAHVLPPSARGALEAALTASEALELEAVAAAPNDAAAVPAMPGVMRESAGRAVEVAGVPLRCLVCRGVHFREQRAQLHSAMAPLRP